MKVRLALWVFALGILLIRPDCPTYASSPGQLDLSFDPGQGINGLVTAMAAEGDGRLVIGGSFTTVKGAFRPGIARLKPDGGVDLTFDPGQGTSLNVSAVRLQPDHRLIIAGAFTTVNGVGRNGIARLNQDGALDLSFDPGTNGSTNVSCLALQPDGKVLVAGMFQTANGTNHYSILRLQVDGRLDADFNIGLGPNSAVMCLALQPDGKILVGGDFTAMNGVNRRFVARLSSDGSLDAGFNPDSTLTPVYSLARQTDGKVVLATYVGPGSDPRIPRLNPDGTLDTTFTAVSDLCHLMHLVAVEADSRIIISGSFTSINGTHCQSVARLTTDGSVDSAFRLKTEIGSILPLPDGKMFIAGSFTSIDGVNRPHLARLNWDGTLDQSFNPGTESGGASILALAPQPDGKMLVGGDFTWLDGVPVGHIARFNGDGALDETLRSGTGADGAVHAILLLPDGKALVGGDFTSFDGVTNNHIARLKPDGSLDTDFQGSAVGWVNAIASAPGGKVVLAGIDYPGPGTMVSFLSRLNADGSPDPDFNPPFTDQAYLSIAVQPDGKVLVGSTCSGPTRLNADGSRDYSFNPGYAWYGRVYGIALQDDGKILLAGWFNWVGSAIQQPFLRLNANGELDLDFVLSASAYTLGTCIQELPNGKLLISGEFTSVDGTPCTSIARLEHDGSLDTNFTAATNLGSVDTFAVQPDGNILVSGDLNRPTGQPLLPFARLFGTQQPPKFWFGSPLCLEDRSLCLPITGDSSESCQIEVATNLTASSPWVPLVCFTNTAGTFLYTDHSASNCVQRFYRSRTGLK